LSNFLVVFQTDAPIVSSLGGEVGSSFFFLFKQHFSKKKNLLNLPFKVDAEKNWKLKTNMQLTVSGDEELRKVPSNLHQGLKDSWVKFLKDMDQFTKGTIYQFSFKNCYSQ